ncbi:DUF4031 domain-containing protein [Kribbella ginsengisoli]|uniref:DUF4031 domain-containing protein n=1 Tax=Kribbella ginsengisoli TaxID=363865 RepID=A0ABP6Y3X0_9ACTN
MTVYVDDMRRQVRPGSERWSHLFATTTRELDEFAAMLGQARDLIEDEGGVHEHYLISDAERRIALACGAVNLSYPRGVALLLATRRRRVTPAADKENGR